MRHTALGNEGIKDSLCNRGVPGGLPSFTPSHFLEELAKSSGVRAEGDVRGIERTQDREHFEAVVKFLSGVDFGSSPIIPQTPQAKVGEEQEEGL
jgi:hypothetical protein